jgi:hypothetical protein
MSAYLGSTQVWGGAAEADENGWVRPADWLAMPTVLATEQKIVGLHAVWPTDGNFCAFTITGAYTVDWGDGTVENFGSGATAYHEYIYTDANLAGTESTRGYKQAIVTIIPQSLQNLTSINFANKANANLASGVSTGWLDVVISAPICTFLAFGSSFYAIRHSLLERFRVISLGAVTSAAYLCTACTTLKSVDLSGYAGKSIASIKGLYIACYALTSPDLAPFAGAPITDIGDLFQHCYLLQIADLSPLAGAPIANISGVISNCYALVFADFSVLAGAPITAASNAFYNCFSLASLIAPIPVSFFVASGKLSATALNALYTSLPTVVGQTLTVTGNYGVSGDDPSIATAKGWTVTG